MRKAIPALLGKYQTKLPGVGKFFQFLKTTPGYIVCIFLPFLILILMQGINSIRLFRKYKKEQQDELQAEKDKIEADRAARSSGRRGSSGREQTIRHFRGIVPYIHAAHTSFPFRVGGNQRA